MAKRRFASVYDYAGNYFQNVDSLLNILHVVSVAVRVCANTRLTLSPEAKKFSLSGTKRSSGRLSLPLPSLLQTSAITENPRDFLRLSLFASNQLKCKLATVFHCLVRPNRKRKRKRDAILHFGRRHFFGSFGFLRLPLTTLRMQFRCILDNCVLNCRASETNWTYRITERAIAFAVVLRFRAQNCCCIAKTTEFLCRVWPLIQRQFQCWWIGNGRTEIKTNEMSHKEMLTFAVFIVFSCCSFSVNLPKPVIGPKTVSSSTVLQFHRRFLNWCLHSYGKQHKIKKQRKLGRAKLASDSNQTSKIISKSVFNRFFSLLCFRFIIFDWSQCFVWFWMRICVTNWNIFTASKITFLFEWEKKLIRPPKLFW